MGTVFGLRPGDFASIPGRVILKTQKWDLMPQCLTRRIYKVRTRGKWSNPGNGVAPLLHLGVVVMEKGAFWSPSTMVANFTYIYIYIYIYFKMNRSGNDFKFGI